MRTAIVILNWNTRDYLDRFLPGILSSARCAPDGTPGDDTAVIVADNASSDGSRELVRERFPGVRLIELDENYGFTGGYNRAFAILEKEGFKYYLLLNSDIEVPRGWLEPLVAHMEANPRCGACGPRLHSYFDKDTFEYAGAAGGYIDRYGYPFCRGRVMRKVEKDEGQYGPASVFWATGAALMVRSSVFHALGGLDDRFFAHQEEIDLCWRMQLEGWSVDMVTASKAWHLGGGTLPQDSPFKLRLNFRNNLLMLSKNLAKTFAIQSYDPRKDEARAARKACRKARRRIWLRMVLDGMSATVWLLSFKKKYFNAVLSGHREFKALREDPSPAATADFARLHGGSRIRGMYPGWIVPSGLLPGNHVFKIVRRFNAKQQ